MLVNDLYKMSVEEIVDTLKFQQQTNPIGLSKKNFVKC